LPLLDLATYLYDDDNRPVLDPEGRLIVLDNRWGQTEELELTAKDVFWVSVINGPLQWEVQEDSEPSSRYIVQTSNVSGGASSVTHPDKPGTLLLRANSQNLTAGHPDQPFDGTKQS
jgi:hypothetical protein